MNGITIEICAAVLASLIVSAIIGILAWIRFSVWRSRRIVRQDDESIDRVVAMWNEAGIPSHELAEAQEIRLWLHGAKPGLSDRWGALLSRRGSRRGKPFEYLIVAERGGRERKIGAALLGTYYPKMRLLFVSYLGQCKESLAMHGAATECLYRRVRRDLKFGALRGALGFVFEVEDPDTQATRARQNPNAHEERAFRARARRRHFASVCQRWRIECRQVGIEYKQPALDTHSYRHEEPMALMVAILKWTRQPAPDIMERSDLNHLLTFVFDHVYWDSFEPDPALHGVTQEYVDRYRKYLMRTKAQLLSSESGGVPLIVPE